jgi:glycosyltransferase involved in cell wall biosynthesis
VKILFTTHGYPPQQSAGAELYTRSLAQALARDHDVLVLAAGWDAKEEHHRITGGRDGAVGLVRINNRRPARDHTEHVSSPPVEALFRKLLDEFRPDVVHVQHVLGLSATLPAIARHAGIPVVLTPHEYFYLCLYKQLLKPDAGTCWGPVTDADCLRCVRAAERLRAHGAREFFYAPPDTIPAPLRAEVGNILARGDAAEKDAAGKEEDPTALSLLVRYARRRLRESYDAADVVLTPSAFLRDAFAAHGFSVDRARVCRNGVEPLAPKPPRAIDKSTPLRLVYTGVVARHKGVHVAIEAMNALSKEEAELHVYGGATWPEYERWLRTLPRKDNVRFHGRYEHEDAAAILGDADAVVVPSLWYENCPFTILEAFALRRPVVASALGGMAELVRNGEGGLTFPAGDAAALARCIRRLRTEPELLGRLRAAIPPVKTIRENADELAAIYRDAAARRRPPPAAPLDLERDRLVATVVAQDQRLRTMKAAFDRLQGDLFAIRDDLAAELKRQGEDRERTHEETVAELRRQDGDRIRLREEVKQELARQEDDRLRMRDRLSEKFNELRTYVESWAKTSPTSVLEEARETALRLSEALEHAEEQTAMLEARFGSVEFAALAVYHSRLFRLYRGLASLLRFSNAPDALPTFPRPTPAPPLRPGAAPPEPPAPDGAEPPATEPAAPIEPPLGLPGPLRTLTLEVRRESEPASEMPMHVFQRFLPLVARAGVVRLVGAAPLAHPGLLDMIGLCKTRNPACEIVLVAPPDTSLAKAAVPLVSLGLHRLDVTLGGAKPGDEATAVLEAVARAREEGDGLRPVLRLFVARAGKRRSVMGAAGRLADRVGAEQVLLGSDTAECPAAPDEVRVDVEGTVVAPANDLLAGSDPLISDVD